MQNFTFVIKHIFGSANKVANALSRRSFIVQEFQVKTLGFEYNRILFLLAQVGRLSYVHETKFKILFLGWMIKDKEGDMWLVEIFVRCPHVYPSCKSFNPFLASDLFKHISSTPL
jgi:hypothetical protein